ATASEDGSARLWEVRGPRSITLLHNAPVSHVAFRDDGQRLLTTAQDGAVRTWNRTGGLLRTLEPRHRGPVVYGAFGANGQIVTAGVDGSAKLWDSAGNMVRSLEGHQRVNYAAFSSDGRLLVTAGANGTARLSDGHGTLLKILEGHRGPVLA